MLKPWLSMMQDGDTITDNVERAGLQANHNGQPVLRGRSSADSQSSGYGLWTMDYGLARLDDLRAIRKVFPW